MFRYLKDRRESSDDGIEVVVRGDRSSEFTDVQRVMRLSAEAGIKDVSLAALQAGDNSGGGN